MFRGGFHGRTAGAMALTSSKGKYRGGYAPLPSGVHIAPYRLLSTSAPSRAPPARTPPRSRGPRRSRVTGCCGEPLRQLRHMLQTETVPEDIAAILVEPVQGEGGYIVPPASFIQGLRAICDEYGILLIADEVQTGFGRTGKFFAIEHFGVTPDIMLDGQRARLGPAALGHRGAARDDGSGGTPARTAAPTAATRSPARRRSPRSARSRRSGMVENAARLGGLLKSELARYAPPPRRSAMCAGWA